jgi:hypothetical protein
MRVSVQRAKVRSVNCFVEHQVIFHATGFSLWLMTKFLGAEFIRRKIGWHIYCRAETFRSGRSPTLQRLAKLEGASPDAPRIFGSAGALPLQKNYSPLATRHSLFAIRRRFGSAGASPSQFDHRLKSVSTKTKPAKAG